MTAVYFAAVTLLEGRPSAVGATIAEKFWPTLAANWLVWPLAHLINFRFVPAPYRIL
jgi:protein Mpv17